MKIEVIGRQDGMNRVLLDGQKAVLSDAELESLQSGVPVEKVKGKADEIDALKAENARLQKEIEDSGDAFAKLKLAEVELDTEKKASLDLTEKLEKAEADLAKVTAERDEVASKLLEIEKAKAKPAEAKKETK